MTCHSLHSFKRLIYQHKQKTINKKNKKASKSSTNANGKLSQSNKQAEKALITTLPRFLHPKPHSSQ